MTVKNLGRSFIFRVFFCHKTRLLFQYWRLELCVPVHTCTNFDCLQFQGGYPTFPDKVFMWFVMELSPFPRIKGFNFLSIFCDINLRLVIISVDLRFFTQVCGSMPFDDSNVAKMLRTILSKPVSFPSRMSERIVSPCKTLITNMLQPDITRRATIDQIRSCKWLESSTPQK